ncbi:uncharacterized protein LOC119370030 [Jatropha curcas]|uniref:uncharacterized protein LOC119370030 n=1 Tax=Jatropha curcas TaxID=180498 RepID=UPI00189501BA|nr:uncharacterized protein LOC119370030 [Jatropha curcas]
MEVAKSNAWRSLPSVGDVRRGDRRTNKGQEVGEVTEELQAGGFKAKSCSSAKLFCHFQMDQFKVLNSNINILVTSKKPLRFKLQWVRPILWICMDLLKIYNQPSPFLYMAATDSFQYLFYLNNSILVSITWYLCTA